MSAPGLPLLRPRWHAGAKVGAAMTTRAGGISEGPFASLNLGGAVGDDQAAVAHNRERLRQAIGATPAWLQQVHGTRVVRVDAAAAEPPQADACWTDVPRLACAVQVADCLPVLFAAPEGRAVAAAHAGWRGLAGGVLEASVRALCEGAGCAPSELRAWLGPCIGPAAFEVGAEVLRAFGADPAAADARLFVARTRADGSAAWLANLPALARRSLRGCGVRRVGGGHWCTVADASSFFSYRRDRVTGRMAALVWRLG